MALLFYPLRNKAKKKKKVASDALFLCSLYNMEGIQ